MEKVIILRYAEIYLKGKNRGFFERALENNLNRALEGLSCTLIKQNGRYLVRGFLEEETESYLDKLKKVFGVHSISIAYETLADMESLFAAARLLCRQTGTFKVESHRGDKKYPLSYDTIVSMNFWGFTPAIFNILEDSFSEFVHNIPKSPDPMKCECYLPMSVGDSMKEGKSEVKVYSTNAKWYGVTYSEDKEKVVAGLRTLIDQGVYPDGLWK